MTTPSRSDAAQDDGLPVAARTKLGCVTSIAGSRDLSDDELRDENARLRRRLARLRTANEELSEDNAHLRGSAIYWRKLYEAALQALNGMPQNP